MSEPPSPQSAADTRRFDAVLLVSFGGPEGPDDVVPFLRNVTKGRGIPDERLEIVGQHYAHFGGVSPINAQNRELLSALEPALRAAGHDLPLYWGNRNWTPLLDDTVSEMRADGITNAIAFVTSAYSSNSGCRQYQDDIEAALARTQVDGSPDLTVTKVRPFFNHPGFIDTMIRNVSDSISESGATPDDTRLIFTAHSIPMGMAENCDYEAQLREVASLVTAGLLDDETSAFSWDLVYQSRSGPPQVPWLEPDVCDHLQSLADESAPPSGVIVVPIGFISDHMEVLWDLDTEAKAKAEQLNLAWARTATVGTDPVFVAAIVELVEEHLEGATPRTIGNLPARPAPCVPGCCAYAPVRPARQP